METVKSPDGTVIAFDRSGEGPPLVVVLGAFCDRMTFVPPAELTARFTVYTYDRRGRGGSGDTPPYSPEREVADLAAVISEATAGSGAGAGSGEGPPLVVVLGAFCDRMTFVPPAELTARFTVYTYDRRGRGGSGDTPPYSPEREVADLAAVVSEATAGAGGGAGSGGAFVYGHSSGAALALRAAWSGVPMAALVAYEAPFIIPGTREVPADPSSTITELVGAGRRGDAVRFWMTDVVRLPAQVVAGMEGAPMWPGLEALTHTLPYDLALTDSAGIPSDDLARITVPVLVLGGANSPDWFRQTVRETTAAIPGARLVVLEGQDHGAPPSVLTPLLTEFFLG